MPFLLFAQEFFSKEFLITPVLYLCFAIRTGIFLNDVKLGILILITNMALKIRLGEISEIRPSMGISRQKLANSRLMTILYVMCIFPKFWLLPWNL